MGRLLLDHHLAALIDLLVLVRVEETGQDLLPFVFSG